MNLVMIEFLDGSDERISITKEQAKSLLLALALALKEERPARFEDMKVSFYG